MSNISSTTTQDDDENSCCESEEDFRMPHNTSNKVTTTTSGMVQKPGTKIIKLEKKVKNETRLPSINNDVGNVGQEEEEDELAMRGIVEQSVTSTPMQTYNEEKMRRKLQFFFMNPIEKWKAKRRFPYKFIIQVIKIVLVTIQLCLFAHSRYNHVNYTWDNKITFSHLFLKDWDSSHEVVSYPPSIGPLAIYVEDDFYASIDYTVVGYSNLSGAIGSYSYPAEDNSMSDLQLCLHRYKEGVIYGFNESYVFNPEIYKTCVNLTRNMTEMGSKQFLRTQNITLIFSTFVKATLEFSLKTVNFKAAGPIAPPDCYQFNVEILYDNSDHDGQMLVSLDAEPIRLHCNGDVQYVTDTEIVIALGSILNMFVILTCLFSMVLCGRAIYRAQTLRIATENFFRSHFGRELSWDGKVEFLNIWYIMIICNDILLVMGSAMKDQIERKHFTANEWNTCSVLLGIGNLLVWFGVLRYLGFFKTYNVVILTLKRAAPKISRFLLCALLLYAGFTFCGWLVLGPYHIKFRSLATTSECLFSLVNGDDMFSTFATMSAKSTMLWWFSRIYLYTFVSLFIYVILSLFISVIMDAYDTIKHYYKDGFPQSDLRSFIGQMDQDDFENGVFRDEGQCGVSVMVELLNRCCCFFKKTPVQDGPTGYTSLVTPSGSV